LPCSPWRTTGFTTQRPWSRGKAGECPRDHLFLIPWLCLQHFSRFRADGADVHPLNSIRFHFQRQYLRGHSNDHDPRDRLFPRTSSRTYQLRSPNRGYRRARLAYQHRARWRCHQLGSQAKESFGW
jgi:hypothetical protein